MQIRVQDRNMPNQHKEIADISTHLAFVDGHFVVSEGIVVGRIRAFRSRPDTRHRLVQFLGEDGLVQLAVLDDGFVQRNWRVEQVRLHTTQLQQLHARCFFEPHEVVQHVPILRVEHRTEGVTVQAEGSAVVGDGALAFQIQQVIIVRVIHVDVLQVRQQLLKICFAAEVLRLEEVLQ